MQNKKQQATKYARSLAVIAICLVVCAVVYFLVQSSIRQSAEASQAASAYSSPSPDSDNPASGSFSGIPKSTFIQRLQKNGVDLTASEEGDNIFLSYLADRDRCIGKLVLTLKGSYVYSFSLYLTPDDPAAAPENGPYSVIRDFLAAQDEPSTSAETGYDFVELLSAFGTALDSEGSIPHGDYLVLARKITDAWKKQAVYEGNYGGFSFSAVPLEHDSQLMQVISMTCRS